MAKVLNIEIGDRISKVCVSEKRKKDYQISNCFLMPTPAGAAQDGQIINVDLLAEALRRELLEHGAANVKSVTFTLSSTKVASGAVRVSVSCMEMGEAAGVAAAMAAKEGISPDEIDVKALQKILVDGGSII